MQSILIDNVLPNVFKDVPIDHSDIWQTKVRFQKGETTLITAHSGRGKTSLLSYLYGLRTDYEGKIKFDDKDVSRLSRTEWDDIHRRHISCLFQDLRLFPRLTAYENIKIKNDLTGYKSEYEIKQLFERLGITSHLNRKVEKMSYGQQQRVAFIRALCQPFDFLFADEPISHLDDVNSNIMAEIIGEELARQGASCIVTSIGKHPKMNYTHHIEL